MWNHYSLFDLMLNFLISDWFTGYSDALVSRVWDCNWSRATGQEGHGDRKPTLHRPTQSAHRHHHYGSHQNRPYQVRNAHHHPRASERHLRRSGWRSRFHCKLNISTSSTLIVQYIGNILTLVKVFNILVIY